MPASSLSPLQRRILHVLVPLSPPWTLTGGGALAGVYLGHRKTRDLDLFWRERPRLDESVGDARRLLTEAGLDVTTLRTTPAFAEFRVSDGADVCVVDLVAEPSRALDAPHSAAVDGVQIPVDTAHEILVNKLTALLGRTELRDLQDVQALLRAGLDLPAALRDAPRKDGGFSVLTLAWVLRSFEPEPLARAVGWSDEQIRAIDRFRFELIDQLTRLGAPNQDA